VIPVAVGARLDVSEIPEDTPGKWTVIEFVLSSAASLHLQRYGAFIEDRPFEYQDPHGDGAREI